MSSVDDLMQQFCPNGVAYRPLSEIGQWYGGGTPSKGRTEFWQNGTIPWLSPKDMGRAVVDSTEDYITEAAIAGSATKLVPANSIAMVVRSSILDRIFPSALIPMAVALNQDMKAVVPKEGLLPTYLAHVLRSRGEEILRVARKTGGSVASIESSKLFAFRVPVPPVNVQAEIVSVLDLISSLEADLEADLRAELNARHTQYVYYRDTLLTFSGAPGVRRVPMAEVGSIFGGLTGKSKADFSDGNVRFVSYVNIYNNSAVNTRADDFVRVGTGEKQRSLQRGDILFTGSSETAGEVAMSSVVVDEVSAPLYLNSFSIGYRLNDCTVLDPRFSKHLFRSSGMRDQLLRTASGVTRFNVSKSRLAKVVVPLPDLNEQRRIATILDSLETLADDLSVSLSAELKARREQYEHYRDRLLTFREAVA